MNFSEYVAVLQKFYEENPQSHDLPEYIGNGYCSSEDVIKINRAPFLRKLWGRAARTEHREVVFLL